MKPSRVLAMMTVGVAASASAQQGTKPATEHMQCHHAAALERPPLDETRALGDAPRGVHAPMSDDGIVRDERDGGGVEGEPASRDGMVWVAGGTFTMGADGPRAMPNERPARRVTVEGFWIDATPVTNAEFAEFVEATGYVTTAERPVDWEELKKQVPPGTPKPAEEMLRPGSLVFTPPDHAVDLRDMRGWWTWTPGASWRHPEGPGSTIEGREEHPVVQVSWDDAVAYARWAGKRLPTEAEWEYAARGGSEGTRYHWGDQFLKDGQHMANTFTGEFPHRNTAADGFERTSPVKSFAPNGYGLYDMAGNVWQWTADRYRETPDAPPHPFARVIKGGSFLCHVDYCESYRPTARRALPADTGSGHVGFRCVRDAGRPTSEDRDSP